MLHVFGDSICGASCDCVSSSIVWLLNNSGNRTVCCIELDLPVVYWYTITIFAHAQHQLRCSIR